VSLQIALLVIGVFVVIGIYFLSTRYGKYKLAPVNKKPYRDSLSVKDAPRLDRQGIADFNSENKIGADDAIVAQDHDSDSGNSFPEHDEYIDAGESDWETFDSQGAESDSADQTLIEEEEAESMDNKKTLESALDAAQIEPDDSEFNLSRNRRLSIEPILDSETRADYSGETTMPEFEYLPPEGFEKISQIDYWVKVAGERDVSRESVLAIYRESASSLTKKSHIYGLRLPDKMWCDLERESEDARFGDLVITIQLADRNGAIEKREITRFSTLIANLSEGTGRGFTFMAPIESALEQADAIACFARYFDSVFVVNIKPIHSEVFEMSTINRCSLQIGLERSSQNYYARNKPIGKRRVCLYSLANMSDTGEFDFDNLHSATVKGVTFFTRPAQVRSPGAVFTEMVDTAKAFASRIKGEIVTPGQDDLSQNDVEIIRRSIENVAEDMERHGIAPGSDEAIRIFE